MESSEFSLLIKKSTIVYIEDDLEVRKYISEFLRRYCENVYEADNAEDGLKLYEEVNPDIMFVDINLPLMSGLELVSKIREDDNYTRIIISTAYTDQDFILNAVELNLTRYLVKPITSKEIIEVLTKALVELEKLNDKFKEIDLGEGFIYDTKKMLLLKDDEPIILRKKEKLILEYLIRNINHVVSYEDLETKVWKNGVMSSDAIRSQVKNIRQKTYSKIITNISGIGYKLNRQ
jgi:DNA-binding response OmpR family regulator